MANSLNKVTTKSILDATVATADIADDAVTLAKMAAGTDGQIITYDASGNPTAVGPGTDGQVLTSTGAGSPPAFEAIPTQISLANDANNRIITGTGSGLNGEAKLTFDGSTLGQSITSSQEGITLTAAGNHYANINVDVNRTGANNGIMNLQGYWDGTPVAAITMTTGDDTTNKDDGYLRFYTATSGSTIAERMRVQSDGDVNIIDGDLVIGTSGHGIDFSAAGNAGGMTSELLDSYEEGTFTPTLTNGPSISDNTGRYIRIGKTVHCWWAFTTAADGPSGHVSMNLPFTMTSTNPPCGGTAFDYRSNTMVAHLSSGTASLYFYDVDASWLAGSSAIIENEYWRACTTYEVA